MADGFNTTFDSVVERVQRFEGTSKKTGRAYTRYSIFTPDGTEWKTFDGPLANTAFNLRGREARFTGRISQNGDFTNYDLEHIEALDAPSSPGMAAATQALQTAQAIPTVQAPTSTSIPLAGASPGIPGNDPQGPVQPLGAGEVDFSTFAAHHDASEARKNVSIHRQTAAKVSAALSQTAGEFWENVQLIYDWMHEGKVPSLYGATEAADVPRDTSQGIPTASTAFDAPPPKGDEDIPF